jgi:hypothetical protein
VGGGAGGRRGKECGHNTFTAATVTVTVVTHGPPALLRTSSAALACARGAYAAPIRRCRAHASSAMTLSALKVAPSARQLRAATSSTLMAGQTSTYRVPWPAVSGSSDAKMKSP